MGRFFNVAGPCVPGQHYMLPPQERCPAVQPLIEQGLYFVIHSARQTGKTTLLRALGREMNSQDRFHALYCSLESLQGIIRPEDGIPAAIRTLSSDFQHALEAPIYPYALAKYRKGSGLDMGFLLKDFQQFWRENSAIWRKRFDYKEAAPHLVLMAFLQRVLNGGGRIVREMAAETRRLDLCVELDGFRYPIELKIRRSEKTEAEGMGQLGRYMETLGCREGWLVIFDRDPSRSWDEKVFWKTEPMADGKTLHLVGC